jgi:hypothetical protein
VAVEKSPLVEALDKCRLAYQKLYAQQVGEGGNRAAAHHAAKTAYKLAMPSMDGLASIKAYIACVAQGIQFEVFGGRDGSQLLYAAQVALSLYSREKEDKHASLEA